MSAPITKDQFVFTLGNASYVDYALDEPPVADVKHSGFGQWLSRINSAFADWRQRQTVLHELAMLSDRELADIGLTRADLPRVFDPAFAADHPRGNDYFGW